MQQTKALVLMRRDLRLYDHAALSAATKAADEVYLLFIFDKNILDPLKPRADFDRRVQFICESLAELQSELKQYQARLIVRYGEPTDIVPLVAKELNVQSVYWNRDYTAYPLERDRVVSERLQQQSIKVFNFKDHVIFEPHEILTKEAKPYHVFTPYSRQWAKRLAETRIDSFDVNLASLAAGDSNLDSVQDFLDFAGFSFVENELKGGSKAAKQRLNAFQSIMSDYDHDRDYPGLDGTSKLSVYIRFGCLSIRDLLNAALSEQSSGHDSWLNELIWREFYQMIYHYYPHCKTQAFKEKYNDIIFPGTEVHLQAWKDGQTGFPIIDAAMRCMNETGWMHNRLRMLTASFLCKLALVDWRRGERYFSWKLIDYEFASNNGGWQWASGTGCDAAPYFRIFNPETQSKRYDESGTFIKRFVPELSHLSVKDIHNPPLELRGDYPEPIIPYKENRQRAIELFKQA